MTFTDPLAAYNAASNLEAHLVCQLLNDAGVPAMVVEDVSQVGVWLGGLVYEYSGSYNPVWWGSVVFGVLSALINLPIVEKPAPRLAAAAA